MENIISVRDLEIAFSKHRKNKTATRIIRGVDFDIPKASIIGFIGESGSGKSVTAKTLLNLNDNSITKASEINIAGISMVKGKAKKTLTKEIEELQKHIDKLKNKKNKKDLNLLRKKMAKLQNDLETQAGDGYTRNLNQSKSQWKKIRGKKVAYIPQDSMTSLNPTKTVGKQIIESLKLHNEKLKTNKEREQKAIELLERFGVKDAAKRINSYPHEFSGGMRQRVIIAMTVACMPDVIIADEPTTALDPTVQASVLELFEEIRKEYGISIIFISHDIAVIATLCDYIYVFYAGRVVEKAKTKELFSNPKHPYTWSLMAAMPDNNLKSKRLFTIKGTPPSFEQLPNGDPFSERNPFALKIDFIKEPPLFKVRKDHFAATWLLHPSSPKVKPPKSVLEIMANAKKRTRKVKK